MLLNRRTAEEYHTNDSEESDRKHVDSYFYSDCHITNIVPISFLVSDCVPEISCSGKLETDKKHWDLRQTGIENKHARFQCP